MYLKSLLDSAELVEEGNLDESLIVLVPAGVLAWAEKTMAVSRDKWESVYTQYKPEEPDVEAIMSIIFEGADRDFLREFAQTEAVMDAYSRLVKASDGEAEGAASGSGTPSIGATAHKDAVTEILNSGIDGVAETPVAEDAGGASSGTEPKPAETTEEEDQEMPTSRRMGDGMAPAMQSSFDEGLEEAVGVKAVKGSSGDLPIFEGHTAMAPIEAPKPEEGAGETATVTDEEVVPVTPSFGMEGKGEDDLPTSDPFGSMPPEDDLPVGDPFASSMPMPRGGNASLDALIQQGTIEPPQIGGEVPATSAAVEDKGQIVDEAESALSGGDLGGDDLAADGNPAGTEVAFGSTQTLDDVLKQMQGAPDTDAKAESGIEPEQEGEEAAAAEVAAGSAMPDEDVAEAEEGTRTQELKRCIDLIRGGTLPSDAADWAAPCLRQFQSMLEDFDTVFETTPVASVLQASQVSAGEFYEAVQEHCHDISRLDAGAMYPGTAEGFRQLLLEATVQALYFCSYDEEDQAVDIANLFAVLIYEE